MKPNTISDKPVRTQYGYHIIMVTDRAESSTTPFEKAKSDIKGYLENQKQIEAIDKLTESLKKNAKIDYVNPEYSPDANKKAIQESIKNGENTVPKPQKYNDLKKRPILKGLFFIKNKVTHKPCSVSK